MLLKYLFNISNENTYKVITILGIKLKFKSAIKQLEQHLKKENKLLKRQLFDLQETLNNTLTYPMYHLSAFSLGNAGDNILVSAIRKSMEDNLAYRPDFISRSARQTVTQEDIYLMNKTNAIIIGGGGLFLKDTNKNDISGWQCPIAADLIKRINTPLFLMAIGYNRFRGQEDFEPYFKDNLNTLVEKASFVGIRNNGSIRALKNYLRDDLKEKLVYHPCPTTILSKIYNIPKYESEPFIAVNCAFDREELRFGNNKDKILNSLAKSIKVLSNNYKIKYYVHCNFDEKFLPYLDNNKVPYEVVHLNGSRTEEDFLKHYSTPKLVIGMRGHAQMIPFGCNTPILSIISHDKLAWFLEDIQHTEWGADVLSEHFENEIIEKANYILDNDKLVKTQIKEAQEKLYNITITNFKYINNILMEKTNVY